jgi:hypothetical protein
MNAPTGICGLLLEWLCGYPHPSPGLHRAWYMFLILPTGESEIGRNKQVLLKLKSKRQNLII